MGLVISSVLQFAGTVVLAYVFKYAIDKYFADKHTAANELPTVTAEDVEKFYKDLERAENTDSGMAHIMQEILADF